jgi:hypothetical protein
MTKLSTKNYVKRILTVRNKFTGQNIVPELRFYETKIDFTIIGMPRELQKNQIDEIMEIIKGVDYKLVVQRGSDRHMMTIDKIDKKDMVIK